MRILMACVVAALTAAVVSPTAFAADVCAQYCDYLCRHYRQDLRPEGLQLASIPSGLPTFRTLSVKVKNGGDVAFGSPGQSRSMLVNVAGVGLRTATIVGEIAPQASRWVSLGVVGNRIRHCSQSHVAIDVNRDAGQFGCGVFSNDTAEMRVYERGQRAFCRGDLIHPGWNP